jgi:TonB family protein
MIDRLGLRKEDRVFAIAFGVSLAAHLLFLIGQLLQLGWFVVRKDLGPIEVVYNYEMATKAAQDMRAQLARAQRDAVGAPVPGTFGERMQVRIPDRPQLAADRDIEALVPTPGAVVDLTDLVDASRGDPVLLSYFGAIRERIQYAANQVEVNLDGEQGGLVYVSFTLLASGAIQDVAIVSERSAPGPRLREVALRIVRAAGRFPPFPPSMPEERKTIVVPLEFLPES